MSAFLAIEVDDLAGTERFGRAIADRLFRGAVLGLTGPLGAGKTHLVKAIAVGLDIPNPSVVNSPTFVLIQEYDARLPIYHFDAYRLSSEAEFADLGPEEYFRGDGVCLVEWSDKAAASLPAERLDVRIVPSGETSRRFECTAWGEKYEAILKDLEATAEHPGCSEQPGC